MYLQQSQPPPLPGPAPQLNPVSSLAQPSMRGTEEVARRSLPGNTSNDSIAQDRFLSPQGHRVLPLKEGMMSFGVTQKTDTALAVLESIWDTPYHVLFCFALFTGL